MCLASQYGHTSVVRLLLASAKTDADLSDNSGWTPLSLAACHGHVLIVKLLLESGGVDVNSMNEEGQPHYRARLSVVMTPSLAYS